MLKLFLINDQLVLESREFDLEVLKKNSTFKLKVKKYIENLSNNNIVFRKNIYFKDIEKIITSLEKISKIFQTNLQINKEVYEYIDKVDSYIEYKNTIGNDIKNGDERFLKEYKKFKDIVNSMMIRKLRPKQMKDAFYLTLMQKAGNFSVPGSGKTSTVYGMYAYLKQTKKVKRIIMIGPLNSFSSWINEFEECFGRENNLNFINVNDFTTSREKQMALKYESGNKELILLNYEALNVIKEEISNLVNEETLVVYDEVHRIKNPEGKRANIAINITKNAKFMVILTGTPIPNGYVDIYNLLMLMYPYDFNKFFNFTIPLLKKPNIEEIKLINDKIQPFFTRTSKNELGVPKANDDEIIKLHANEIEQQIFDILVSKFKNSPLTLFIKIMQLESVPTMLLETLDFKDFEKMLDLNVSHEDLMNFVDYSEDIKAYINKIDLTSKMKETINIVSQINKQSKTVIIWCIFVKTMNKLKIELAKVGVNAEIISGNVDIEERNIILEKFKNKDIDVLITNPHTLAESVSLHKTCHDAIYFEYSYNLVHLLQSKDRIHRLGLKDSDYTQYYYLNQFYEMQQGDYSLGEKIYKRLHEKEQLMLDAIDNHQLEMLPTEDEDLKYFFKIFNS
ncbi:SNF2-related protein [Staphylococcus pseudintermedius]|uniref:SNF2-related protein n=3 Tax=Staphylococcus pseudintermedius TaxID=283734 RepID=UPI0007AE38B3|nr:SNF2-related protein [Staphylococcus pseudintermedius]EGQ3399750.1 DEAD/DEAH box helicase family protein [Staphylococcus pseudintermedius]EGQ3447301.1 DEAD/DEAH box helicase family protein [Staphylococcus pseudintermedius]EGQ3902453.1 ATP-dependent helicase [Staphylococcus pseudintermedius]EGQ4045487.1 ATP-dependent helicase [Staphylococcus pseudintermedius]EGQ4075064.1 ATP-dependent helicase [Staphylococcus pseudintermedius]